jgi:hypothetical protein
LHSLLEFLTAAPKSYVIRLHRRQDPNVGLMQAGKVIQLVYDWAMLVQRINDSLREVDKQGRYLLALIYISEERGATETELLSSLDGFPPSQVLMLLGRMEQDLLIFSRDTDKSRTYHGFREMAELVMPMVLKEQAVTGPGLELASWISYRHFLTSHLSHFLCQVALGAVKITQNGEMHRKDQQELAQRLSFGEKLSSALPGEEVQLLLHFAAATQLVLQEDGMLFLSAEGKEMLKGTRSQAWCRFMEWWTTSRVHGMSYTLKALASMAKTGASPETEKVSSPSGTSSSTASRVSPWANLFWIFSGTQRKGYLDEKTVFTWENLPKVLQELWLFGLVEFGMVKGRIAWIRPVPETIALFNSQGESEPSTTIDPVHNSSSHLAGTSRPISLPNLESLVPLDSPLTWHHRIELVGHKSNDEFMARYHFTKESVIQGLQAGLPMEEFKELLTWLGFEAPARRTLLDWASTYASTLFMDALVLKVSDPVRFLELQEIPQFVELVNEVIPNYGFVLNRQNKPRVKELLQHFGLVPGEDARRTLQLERVILTPAGGTWELPVPDPGLPAYRETPGSLRAPPSLSQDKSAINSREQEMALLLLTLEEAIAQEKKVEFSYPSPVPKRITLRPLLILRHRDPVKLIGIELDSGHRNEYVLDNVKALRIME